MLCHSIYLQVVKVHLFNLGLPINRYTFVLPSENQNAFYLLSICANVVYNVIQSLKDYLVDQIFCKDMHESLKYVDELSELKIMTKFKKNTHLSLSTCRSSTKADAHDKMGFQYISISVDLVRSHARIQRGDRGSGPPHLKNHKNIEFLSNTGPHPLKFSKLPSQHSTLGHHQHASETPFKGVSLAGR